MDVERKERKTENEMKWRKEKNNRNENELKWFNLVILFTLKQGALNCLWNGWMRPKEKQNSKNSNTKSKKSSRKNISFFPSRQQSHNYGNVV